MTEKDATMPTELTSSNAMTGSDVLVAFVRESGTKGSIALADDDIRQIKELEQYAILAGQRIGEFRVG